MNHYTQNQIELEYLRDEVERLKEKLNNPYIAKALLKKKGYYVENLWCVDDVTQNYKCTDEEAQMILHKAMTSESTIEHVFSAIDIFADYFSIRTNQE